MHQTKTWEDTWRVAKAQPIGPIPPLPGAGFAWYYIAEAEPDTGQGRVFRALLDGTDPFQEPLDMAALDLFEIPYAWGHGSDRARELARALLRDALTKEPDRALAGRLLKTVLYRLAPRQGWIMGRDWLIRWAGGTPDHKEEPPVKQGKFTDQEHRIIEALRRRGYTNHEIAKATDRSYHMVNKQISKWARAGKMRSKGTRREDAPEVRGLISTDAELEAFLHGGQAAPEPEPKPEPQPEPVQKDEQEYMPGITVNPGPLPQKRGSKFGDWQLRVVHDMASLDYPHRVIAAAINRGQPSVSRHVKDRGWATGRRANSHMPGPDRAFQSYDEWLEWAMEHLTDEDLNRIDGGTHVQKPKTTPTRKAAPQPEPRPEPEPEPQPVRQHREPEPDSALELRPSRPPKIPQEHELLLRMTICWRQISRQVRRLLRDYNDDPTRLDALNTMEDLAYEAEDCVGRGTD